MLASLLYTIEYTTIIVAFLTGVAGPVILALIRHRLNRKNYELEKRKKDFIHTIEIQKVVNETLNSLQDQYNLDRVWLAQFHNGGNFFPGNRSMKKMSVTFESTAPGISTDLMKMQNLPVSFFSSALQKLGSGSESCIINIDTEEDYALQSFWANRGINCVYLFPIICIRGGFVGILGVDFVKKDDVLDDHVHNNLKKNAHLLSGYVAQLSTEDNK
jgi:hypothetical protein